MISRAIIIWFREIVWKWKIFVLAHNGQTRSSIQITSWAYHRLRTRSAVLHKSVDGTRLVQDALDAAANAAYWVLPGPLRDIDADDPEAHHIEVYFSKDLRPLLEDFEADPDDQMDAVEHYWNEDMHGYRLTAPRITAEWADGFENGTRVNIINYEPLALGAEGGEQAGDHRSSLLDDLGPLFPSNPPDSDDDG